jgi:hypothetical protein
MEPTFIVGTCFPEYRRTHDYYCISTYIKAYRISFFVIFKGLLKTNERGQEQDDESNHQQVTNTLEALKMLFSFRISVL